MLDRLITALLPIGIAAATGAFFGGPQTGQKAASLVGGEGKGPLSLADSFLVSSGAMALPDDKKGVQPFQPPEIVRARSLGQMGLGSAGSQQPVRLDPVVQMIREIPELQTAVIDMFSNARNPQFRDFSSKYAAPQITLAQGRRSLTSERPGNIQV
jgi:hypothetical protein